LDQIKHFVFVLVLIQLQEMVKKELQEKNGLFQKVELIFQEFMNKL